MIIRNFCIFILLLPLAQAAISSKQKFLHPRSQVLDCECLPFKG